MKNIYITGISGTGKTTIGNILKQQGLAAYSIDEVPGLCYWVNRSDDRKVDYEAVLDQEFINHHKWVCDTNKIKELVKNKDGIIVLGLADNQSEFLPLFDKVLLLQCRPETFIKRIEERVGNDFGKEKSAQEYILNMYQGFEKDMLAEGAVPINAEKPLDEVVESIRLEIERG